MSPCNVSDSPHDNLTCYGSTSDGMGFTALHLRQLAAGRPRYMHSTRTCRSEGGLHSQVGCNLVGCKLLGGRTSRIRAVGKDLRRMTLGGTSFLHPCNHLADQRLLANSSRNIPATLWLSMLRIRLHCSMKPSPSLRFHLQLGHIDWIKAA